MTSQFPQSFGMLAEVLVSIKRIEVNTNYRTFKENKLNNIKHNMNYKS